MMTCKIILTKLCPWCDVKFFWCQVYTRRDAAQRGLESVGGAGGSCFLLQWGSPIPAASKRLEVWFVSRNLFAPRSLMTGSREATQEYLKDVDGIALAYTVILWYHCHWNFLQHLKLSNWVHPLESTSEWTVAPKFPCFLQGDHCADWWKMDRTSRDSWQRIKSTVRILMFLYLHSPFGFASRFIICFPWDASHCCLFRCSPHFFIHIFPVADTAAPSLSTVFPQKTPRNLQRFAELHIGFAYDNRPEPSVGNIHWFKTRSWRCRS